jgi:hypothetical protein
MADFVFTRGCYEIFNGTAVPGTADFRALLLDTDYTQDKNDNVLDDLDSDEISVSGYSRQALANETLTEDDTNDRVYMDADDVTFSSLAAGQTVGWGILYRHTGNDATAPTISAYDVTNTPTNGGNIVIQWTAPGSGGVLYLA